MHICKHQKRKSLFHIKLLNAWDAESRDPMELEELARYLFVVEGNMQADTILRLKHITTVDQALGLKTCLQNEYKANPKSFEYSWPASKGGNGFKLITNAFNMMDAYDAGWDSQWDMHLQLLREYIFLYSRGDEVLHVYRRCFDYYLYNGDNCSVVSYYDKEYEWLHEMENVLLVPLYYS